MREAGPVVWIPKYFIFAMARYDEAKATLKDWETCCSSAGGGLTNFYKEKPWRKPSIVLEADPPLHTRTRGVFAKVLSRVALEKLCGEFTERASGLLDHLLEKVKTIELVGEPVRQFKNTLRGLSSLPLRLVAA